METRLVPSDLIFAYPDELFSRESKKNNPRAIHANSVCVPLVVIKMETEMVRAFYRGKSFHNLHRKWYVTKYTRAIGRLLMSLSRGKPLISGIDRDRLILSDGIEQWWLAKTLGRKWIRVRMPDEVCDKWDSRPIDKLKSVIKNTDRKAFYNPVLHPDFRQAKVSRPDSTRIDRIRCILGSLGEGLTGLDVGCNMGYMAHHLQRQGFDMTGIDFDENHLAMANALNETYGLNTRFINCRFAEFEPKNNYDVVFALSVLYHMFFRQNEMDKVSIAKKIGTLTRSALFWESGDQPEKEKELIISYSGLSEYLSLGKTKGTGLNRELGVFLRPDVQLSKILSATYRKYIISGD